MLLLAGGLGGDAALAGAPAAGLAGAAAAAAAVLLWAVVLGVAAG